MISARPEGSFGAVVKKGTFEYNSGPFFSAKNLKIHCFFDHFGAELRNDFKIHLKIGLLKCPLFHLMTILTKTIPPIYPTRVETM
jgi:hypothetical protein